MEKTQSRLFYVPDDMRERFDQEHINIESRSLLNDQNTFILLNDGLGDKNNDYVLLTPRKVNCCELEAKWAIALAYAHYTICTDISNGIDSVEANDMEQYICKRKKIS